MNYKLSDLKGIDLGHVERLRVSRIETTSDLMEVWNDPPRMTTVAANAGISDEQLRSLVSMARVARMKGVGPKYVGLLVAAGVIGRRSLSKHTPETLLKRLGEVSVATGLRGPVPTLAEVQLWFAELKPIASTGDPTL
jgi:hypothetical protein